MIIKLYFNSKNIQIIVSWSLLFKLCMTSRTCTFGTEKWPYIIFFFAKASCSLELHVLELIGISELWNLNWNKLPFHCKARQWIPFQKYHIFAFILTTRISGTFSSIIIFFLSFMKIWLHVVNIIAFVSYFEELALSWYSLR